VFQTEGVAVACHLRDREAMKDRCFCEAAACEVAVTTVRNVSCFAQLCDSARDMTSCMTK
jgi:hypothetical protein